MMQTLPVHLNFAQKAKIGFEIKGNCLIKQFKRLKDVLASDQGEAMVSLKFDRAGPIPFVVGHINVEVQFKCQRCMSILSKQMDIHFKLGFVQNDTQMERLPEEYEPYLLTTDENHLLDMLEEEILLALPLVPMHESDCSEYLQKQISEQKLEVEETAEEKDKENPFSVLKDLL